MFTDNRSDEDAVIFTDSYYEEQACQEEIYLEETEEELRIMLESADSPPLQSENLREERENAVEELITGDSDDPPLPEDSVEEMVKNILGDLDR